MSQYRLYTIIYNGESVKLKVHSQSSQADVRRAISNRFALPSDSDLQFIDASGDVVSIQSSLPSGTYNLTAGKCQDKLVFALNGKRIEIDAKDVDPTITLNDYIRYHTEFKGTKLACGEGGCGACAVTLSRYDAKQGKVIYLSCNSCLKLLPHVDGWSVTTTEGIGGVHHKNGFHPAQERIAEWSGLQCGFCTPGMVMSLYTGLKRNQSAGGSGLTKEDIENLFDGNLCRCTGYRPILGAAKSFAIDGKDEKDGLSGAETRVKPYDPELDPPFPEFLKSYKLKPLRFSGSGLTYLRPLTFAQAFQFLDESKGQSVRWVASNTSVGVYKEENYQVYIDISAIPELNELSVNDEGVKVGGNAPLNVLIDHLEAVSKDHKGSDKVARFGPLVQHIKKIAGQHIRNVASTAGNLVLAKTKGFLSDLATILLAAEASVHLVSKKSKRTESLEDFLSTPDFKTGEIVASISIPFGKPGDHFNTYKTALRALNCHAYVNAGFNINIARGKITRAVLAFGGIGEEDVPGSHALRAKKTEAFLVGKSLSKETLREAINSISKEIVPHGSVTYHTRLLTGYFFKFFVALIKDEADARVRSVAEPTALLAATEGGKQEFKFARDVEPVHFPIPRPRGAAFASGETPYTGDIKFATRTLFAAYVTTQRASGKILRVDTSKALKAPGVEAYISQKDVPGDIQATFPGAEPPLPVAFVKDNVINFYGQAVGVILADTTRHAEAAAKLVELTYEEGKSMISEKEAIEEKKTQTGAEYTRGDADAFLATAKHKVSGTFHFGTQQHFYMEPQVAYVVPEDDGVIVYNALQWPDAVHVAVSKALKIPLHQVRVIHKRAGGGFGGKIIPNIQHAVVAAICAQATRRPVALILNRNKDMLLTGGRHDVDYKYEVAFDESGMITAMKAVGVLNAGYTADFTGFCASATASSADECYYVPHWSMKTEIAYTNMATRTAVRGPGEIQGSFMIESIIEHVSEATGIPAQEIREKNLYSDAEDKKDLLMTPNKVPITHYTVPKMWASLKKSANIERRFAEIDAYNKSNRWKKRGLAMTTVRYHVSVFQKNALVNIYSDGTVLITQGGSEIGQGLFVKVAQVAAATFGQLLGKPLPLDLIRFNDTDSSIVPNALFTGGSTGSEGAAMAVKRAAETLIERLKPILADLEKKREEKGGKDEKEISWQDVIAAARAASIDLSAEAQWAGRFSGKLEDDSLIYNNYGVAASEVELDVVTGEVTCLQTDILYDCGKSLNPAVDIGQAEGAFMMGVGCLLREKVLFVKDGKHRGKLISDGTWKYKIPGIKDVPKRFNISFAENPDFKKGILSSKSSGEPPLVLATSVLMAVRYAIRSARKDAGLSGHFILNSPATPEDIALACGATPADFTVSA